MNRALKWKLVAGLVLVFLAGGMTGAFIVASQTHHLFFGPYRGAISDRIRHRLRTQLRLTDEQMAKISPIIDKTATQLETIRTETARRVHETFAEAHREIAADLTPEQRSKLQAIEERHRRWFHPMHGARASPSPEASPSPQ
jgi:Spy/CpxP family protein refolding chaperone